MKPIMTITDPEAVKVAVDETRRKMLYLLRAKEMTVSKIAEELNLTPQTVYHHIKKLCDVEMVEVAKEVRVDHLIESYYRATAEVFHFTVGKSSNSKETAIEKMKSALEALKKIGYSIQYNQQTINELAELSIELEDCCDCRGNEEAIAKLNDVDYFTKQEVQEYAGLLSMTDQELIQHDQVRKRFTELLRSIVIKKT
jgi:DNA-binding transcriptional ArsR family regulator